jgi:20S proteasome alpha/beta subunit
VPLGGMCIRQRMAIGGSGSTYVYGYVDSHVSDVKTKKECLEFVTNSMYRVPKTGKLYYRCYVTFIEYISLQIVCTSSCYLLYSDI